MSTADAMTKECALLWRLAELGMGVAQRLHDAMQASDDLDALARVGAAFHQVSRGVRQSLALEARLAAGWTPAAYAARPEPVAVSAPPAPERPARERPEATGWNEYERLDCDESLDEFAQGLGIDELDGLADAPEDQPIDHERLEAALEAGVSRLRRGVLALRPPRDPQPAAPARANSRTRLMGGAARLLAVNSS